MSYFYNLMWLLTDVIKKSQKCGKRKLGQGILKKIHIDTPNREGGPRKKAKESRYRLY